MSSETLTVLSSWLMGTGDGRQLHKGVSRSGSKGSEERNTSGDPTGSALLLHQQFSVQLESPRSSLSHTV